MRYSRTKKWKREKINKRKDVALRVASILSITTFGAAQVTSPSFALQTNQVIQNGQFSAAFVFENTIDELTHRVTDSKLLVQGHYQHAQTIYDELLSLVNSLPSVTDDVYVPINDSIPTSLPSHGESHLGDLTINEIIEIEIEPVEHEVKDDVIIDTPVQESLILESLILENLIHESQIQDNPPQEGIVVDSVAFETILIQATLNQSSTAVIHVAPQAEIESLGLEDLLDYTEDEAGAEQAQDALQDQKTSEEHSPIATRLPDAIESSNDQVFDLLNQLETLLDEAHEANQEAWLVVDELAQYNLKAKQELQISQGVLQGVQELSHVDEKQLERAHNNVQSSLRIFEFVREGCEMAEEEAATTNQQLIELEVLIDRAYTLANKFQQQEEDFQQQDNALQQLNGDESTSPPTGAEQSLEESENQPSVADQAEAGVETKEQAIRDEEDQ